VEVGSSLRIPNFLSAGSPQGLRRLMLLNNIRNGKQYNYFDIQFVGSKWFVWFFEKEDVNKLLTQSEAMMPNGMKK
jgi:hypothetical protein